MPPVSWRPRKYKTIFQCPHSFIDFPPELWKRTLSNTNIRRSAVKQAIKQNIALWQRPFYRWHKNNDIPKYTLDLGNSMHQSALKYHCKYARIKAVMEASLSLWFWINHHSNKCLLTTSAFNIFSFHSIKKMWTTYLKIMT